MNTKDISTREDIEDLIRTFYGKALDDAQLGPVFKAANFSLAAHIPVMISFWETILLDVITYSGNPMRKHMELNRTVTLDPAHFEQWMKIWKETITEKFRGPVAENAMIRADSIALIIQHKLKQN
ncbi:group III truncated hemoglobin [Pedobacter metabolipauper]|nr:group III truncated hemoglobin [Pedobacter metabolipauper]